jgi:hypothetical protein
MQQGMDYSPIQSPWQGLARVAQALVGGYESGQIDAREKAREQEASDLLLQNPMLTGGVDPAAVSAPMQPGAVASGAVIPNDANAFPGQAGMDARLADASQDFIQDNPGTYLSSGVRSTADQARLYADRANNPNPVARPGTSRHERGLAVDIGGMTPDQRAMLPQYGLGQPVANDPPHVELAADPMAIPLNAQATQGFVGAGGIGAQSVPSIPPAMATYIRRTLSNPLTRAAGMQLLQQYSKPREMHTQMTDTAGNIWDVNQLTGQRTIALKKDKPEAAPASVREYEYYAKTLPQGQVPLPYQQWEMERRRSGATSVNVNGGGSDKQIFDAFDERTKEARQAASGIASLRNARMALQGEGGNITGFRANERLALQKAASYLGITDSDAIKNTETFRAAIAPQVAATLKATVGTNQISNSDREFAEKAAGGSITLDEGSINRLLNIMEKAAEARLQEHQRQLDAVYPDPEKNRRERALFSVSIPPHATAPFGSTKSGIKWSVE